jgi:DNA-binding MarR family transcriptional regulator
MANSGDISAPALSISDYQTLAEFRYLLRQFLTFSESVARQAGLTAQQHQSLLAIKGYPDQGLVTIAALAERLSIAHHSAVGLVNRLEGRGLVCRKIATQDRRQVLVNLTPLGEGILEQLSATHRQELRQLAPLLRSLLEDFQTQ